MSKLTTRLGAAVALAAGASALASGTAFADTANHSGPAHVATDPSADQGSEDTPAPEPDGKNQDDGDCELLGMNHDALLSLKGAHLNWPGPLHAEEGQRDLDVDPVCAALTYGPFSTFADQEMPFDLPAPQTPAPPADTTQSPQPETGGLPLDAKTRMPSPLSALGAPSASPGPTNPDTDATAQENPLGGLLSGSSQEGTGQGNGTGQSGSGLLPGLL